MRALVTGGAGFIGSHVASALVDAGHEVLIIDDLSSGNRCNVPKGAELCELSIVDTAAHSTVIDFAPEAVFHHAAQIDVRVSVARPVHDARLNVLGTIQMAEAAKEAGTAVFVFASTGGAIYGEQDVFPAPEEHPLRPVSPYGVSKLCGENYLEYFERSSDMRVVRLRYANVYGPRQDPHGEAGVVAIFSNLVLAGKTPTIHGDGEQTRDFVYVGDVVAANMAALESRVSDVFNIGTGVETDVNALAAVIARAADFHGKAEHGPEKPGEQRRSVISAAKAARVLGWQPRVELEKGIRLTVESFRSTRSS